MRFNRSTVICLAFSDAYFAEDLLLFFDFEDFEPAGLADLPLLAVCGFFAAPFCGAATAAGFLPKRLELFTSAMMSTLYVVPK